ncbi:MAG TPA: type II toxin-antitoxin system prevent-host-death family antitoxin [Spirochaetia bacterium]|nr:type II toxin-antitoxin system prevent-host-death family antitoxin [Spirochaetia bacterium]
MEQINMHQAKTQLSRLVEALESGAEDEITIARNGKPVARLVRIEERRDARRRIGVARGAFTLPEQTSELEHEIEGLFAADADRSR